MTGGRRKPPSFLFAVYSRPALTAALLAASAVAEAIAPRGERLILVESGPCVPRLPAFPSGAPDHVADGEARAEDANGGGQQHERTERIAGLGQRHRRSVRAPIRGSART